jgi:hypothetical protein
MQAVKDHVMNPGGRAPIGPLDMLPGRRPDPPVTPSGQPGPKPKALPGRRPKITGAADSVMGAPLTPPTGKKLPAAGSSTPGVAKNDKRFELRRGVVCREPPISRS